MADDLKHATGADSPMSSSTFLPTMRTGPPSPVVDLSKNISQIRLLPMMQSRPVSPDDKVNIATTPPRDMFNTDNDLESLGKNFFQNTRVSSLSWSDLTIDIKERKTGEKTSILSNCSGHVKAGQVLALMGPSGSGKTTLLNLLANRSKLHHTGSVNVNGQAITSPAVLQDISSYVQQEDVNIGGLSVRETVLFTSRLASPEMNKTDRTQLTHQVIKALGLQAQTHTLISSPLRPTLSGGQQRRLSLATALVTGPNVLFLDEPTSGLDSAASHEVMTFVRRFARQYNLIVIASIHQPSNAVMDSFDSVLLLSKGKTCYFGPRDQLSAHFAEIAPIPNDTNPLEYLLDVVNTDFRDDPEHAERVLIIWETWRTLQQQALVEAGEHEKDGAGTERRPLFSRAVSSRSCRFSPFQNQSAVDQALDTRQKASFFGACLVLIRRNMIKSYRDPLTYMTRLIINLVLALVTGTVWLRLSYNQSSIQPFINCLFFSAAFESLISIAYAPAIIEDIRMLEKEHANRLYTVLPFMVANFLTGLPWLAAISLTFSIPVYWLGNFESSASGFFTFFLWLYIDLLAAESMVLMTAAFIPQFVTALAITAMFNGVWLAVGGFLVPVHIMNSFWHYAFHYIDFQTYVFQGLMVNQFKDTIYDCERTRNGFFCMFQSDLGIKGQVRGKAVLDNFSYGYARHEWVRWVGIAIAIILVHRIIGYSILRWRVSR